jgi:hypothetical protein
MTNAIDFSYNWNKKLNCKAFTTIRMRNSARYRIGAVYDIFLDQGKKGKEKVCSAEIVNIKDFLLQDIPTYSCWLDTGYSKEETIDIVKKMYANRQVNLATTLFSLILLKRI